MKIEELLELVSKMTKSKWREHRSPTPDNTGGYDYAILDEERKIVAEVYQHVGGVHGAYVERPVFENALGIVALKNHAPRIITELQAENARLRMAVDAEWNNAIEQCRQQMRGKHSMEPELARALGQTFESLKRPIVVTK